MVNTVKKNASTRGGPLCVRSLNHISMVCRSLEDSIHFYENVLGFVRVKRPGTFDFEGAWLFNYGVGIHFLQCANPDDLPFKKTEINPRSNHISFQCEDMQVVERKLQEMDVKYVKRIVEEGGIYVDQLFIHDPDGFMIEFCNCENIPVEPLVSGSLACLRLSSNLRTLPILTMGKEEQTPVRSTVPKQMLVVGAMAGQEELAV